MARTTRQVTSDPASTTEPAAASTRVATRTTARDREPEHKTYVLDTSVLLSDPRAMLRFAEHEVVLPVVVVTELEGKRHHPELGYFARQALRMLDDLRVSEGRLDKPVAVGPDGGTLRVELNHTDPSSLPAGFRLGDNDTRILAVARNLANEGCRRDDRVQGPPDARQGVGVRPRGGGVPPRAGRRLRLDRPAGARDLLARTSTSSTTAVASSTPAPPSCRATPVSSCSRRGEAVWGGSAPTSRSGSSGATATRSACTGAAPSSASPSTCSSTPTWASSASAAVPARASRPWPCAPASSRSWSAGPSARCSSSAPSSPSAARSSATCPAPSRRR